MSTGVARRVKALPEKVENRLSELKQMGEFEDWEIRECRRTYWQDRDGWHTILINCFDRAKARRAPQTA